MFGIADSIDALTLTQMMSNRCRTFRELRRNRLSQGAFGNRGRARRDQPGFQASAG
jgi:hypothetical protein